MDKVFGFCKNVIGEQDNSDIQRILITPEDASEPRFTDSLKEEAQSVTQKGSDWQRHVSEHPSLDEQPRNEREEDDLTQSGPR